LGCEGSAVQICPSRPFFIFSPFEDQFERLGRLAGGWICSGTTAPNCSGGTQEYGFTSGWTGGYLTSACDTVLSQCNSYGYDSFGRLASLNVGAGQPGSFAYVYDRWGNRWQQNLTSGNNGPQPQFSFNTSNNQIAQSGSCAPPNSNQFCYDAAGNMTADGSHTYTYDAENNIIAVDGGATAQYTYDALNRRVQTNVGGTLTEFVYNANGQRVSEWNGSTNTEVRGQYYWGAKPVAFYQGAATVPSGPSGYIYCSPENGTCSFSGTANVAFGANGQFYYAQYTGGVSCSDSVFGDPDVGVVKACFYSMTGSNPSGPSGYSFCAPESGTCSFAGAANVAFGANSQFYYAQYTGGVSCSDSVFGDPDVGVVKACFYSTINTMTYFEHQDWLGTERMRTAYNGSVAGTFTSLPFGDAQTTASGSDLDPYHFAMLDYDSETATDHAQFRQYENVQGRWMSPDPYSGSYDFSNPQSLNRYSYVLNNPLASVDPIGLGQFCGYVATVNEISYYDEDNDDWVSYDQVSWEWYCPDPSSVVVGPHGGGGVRSNQQQNKQQLKQTCDAIYKNYESNFALQKLKNSWMVAYHWAGGFALGAFGGPVLATVGGLVGGGTQLLDEQANNWNMDPINMEAARQLQAAGCFGQGIGY
jgi:RHS repeat-associated protein